MNIDHRWLMGEQVTFLAAKGRPTVVELIKLSPNLHSNRVQIADSDWQIKVE